MYLKHSKNNPDTLRKASWSIVIRGTRRFAENALRIQGFCLNQINKLLQNVLPWKRYLRKRKLYLEIFSLNKFKLCVDNTEETKQKGMLMRKRRLCWISVGRRERVLGVYVVYIPLWKTDPNLVRLLIVVKFSKILVCYARLGISNVRNVLPPCSLV